MAEENNSGQEQTQNAQSEESTSQNEQQQEAYKVFKTEDDYKQAQDKFFRGAYNEGKQKMFKDTIQTAQDKLGIEGEFESVEDVFEAASSKLNGTTQTEEGDSSNKEAEELRKQLQEYKKKAEQKEQEFNSYKRQQKVEGGLESSINALEKNNKLGIKKQHLKTLFQSEHDIDVSDGELFVKRSDGTPVLDGEGNRKPLKDVMADFAKDYMQPLAEGTGGKTGGGSTSDKPRFSKFKELNNSKSQGDKERALEMQAKAREVGWADDDSPRTHSRWG